MSEPDPSTTAPGADRASWRFMLTVRPQTAQHAWHARLCGEDGTGLDFHAPIELLRHLVRLGSRTPPTGRLK